MSKSKVLIPIVHVDGMRVIPHYVSSGSPGDQLQMKYGLDAETPHPRNPDQTTQLTEWLTAPEWVGNLRVVGYHGGRSSSCYAVQIDVPGELPVKGLMSCLVFCAHVNLTVHGVVTGHWGARKQGQNYMIIGV